MAGSGKGAALKDNGVEIIAKDEGKGNRTTRASGTDSMQRWKSVWMKLRRCCSVGKKLTNPLSLGIGSSYASNHMRVCIPRNATIPTRKEIVYRTLGDNQTTMFFPVYEGERILAKSNNLLGNFTLEGIPPAPEGIAKVHVHFAVDANGTITVEAEHKATGRKSSITITNDKRRLSKEDIEEMARDAETYKMKDGEHKKKYEAMQALRYFAHMMRNTIKTERNAARVRAAEKKEIEDAFESALQWLNANRGAAEIDDFKGRLKELKSIFRPIVFRRRLVYVR